MVAEPIPTHARRRATLQQALVTLDQTRRRLQPSEPAGPARRFADYLAGQAPSNVLRYSQRLELIRAARKFGIDRFEANLLIASVLERNRRLTEVEEEAPTSRRHGGAFLAGLFTFGLIQGAMALGVWWIVFR